MDQEILVSMDRDIETNLWGHVHVGDRWKEDRVCDQETKKKQRSHQMNWFSGGRVRPPYTSNGMNLPE